jgi:hypothetical protein
MRQRARRGHSTEGAIEGGWQELQAENQSGRESVGQVVLRTVSAVRIRDFLPF